MRKWLLFIFSISFLAIACNSSFNKIMKSNDADYKLRSADSLYNAKKWDKAQQLYEQLFPVLKGTEQFEELYYKYAYTFYHQELFLEAESMFKGYLDVFPTSARAIEMSYMQAYMLYRQSPKIELEQVNTTKAMSAMQSFIVNNPGSEFIPEATRIIDELRAKLELKEERNAALYYNIGQYRASAIAYDKVLLNYPESKNAEDYKLKSIESYYKFASMSYQEKQVERYEKVIQEVEDFEDRFPESGKLKEAQEYAENSQKQINRLRNEQIAQTVQQ